MEAISLDVPVVATNVGGTGEIVNDETGKLVNENPTPKEVAQAIVAVFDNRLQYRPREFWLQNYVAEKNYTKFAMFLASLTNGTQVI